MSTGNSPGRETSAAQTTHPERAGPDQRTPVSPSRSDSVYPALDNLQRISLGQQPLPAAASGGTSGEAAGYLVNTTAGNRGGHFTRRRSSVNSPHSPTSVQHVSGPALVSQQGLPTYRQISQSSDSTTPCGFPSTGCEYVESSLPDILFSHIVPQVPPARPNQHRQNRANRHRHRHNGDNRSDLHRSRTQSTSSSTQTQEGACKEPCVKCVVTVTSFRWVLVVLSVLGVCCVMTGIVLAALHAAGNSFLFLAIMFIGLGVLLVIVVGVGWKCTPRGHEPLHALFGIGSFRHGHSRERRHRRHRHRDSNWFGGVLYPEFQYRRPPPTYAASMQNYQNQMVQEQETTASHANPEPNTGDSLPNSPPPSYRSRASTAHSGIHTAFSQYQDGDQPNSRPPTYRSRAPSRRPSLPYEDIPEQSFSDSGAGSRAPPDVSFTAPSTVQVTNGVTIPPLSSSSPNTTAQPTSSTVIIQSHSMPILRCSLPDFQNSPPPLNDIHDLSSESSSSCQPSSRPPSLHQRMASEDCRILEQTLKSLEEHMNESEGVTNEGASFDEPDPGGHQVNTRF